MSLVATISYWPNKNYNFGHISIEIKGYDEEEKRVKVFYVSWAMGNDPNADECYHERPPLKIILPLNQNKIEDFERDYKKSPYFLTEDVIQLAGKEDTGLADQKSEKKLSEYALYKAPYSFLDNNCAHAVLDILFFSGYLKTKPLHKPGLRPSAVATEIVCIGFEKYKENIELAKNMKGEEKYEKLCKEIIIALEGYKFNKLQNLVFTSTSNINEAVIEIREIKYSSETEFLQEIIKIAAHFSDAKVIEIFYILIDSFPNEIRYKAGTHLAIVELQDQETQSKGTALTELKETRQTLEMLSGVTITPQNKKIVQTEALNMIKKAKILLNKNSIWSKLLDVSIAIMSRLDNRNSYQFSHFKTKKVQPFDIVTQSITKNRKVI